jgi:hypothetical protein
MASPSWERSESRAANIHYNAKQWYEAQLFVEGVIADASKQELARLVN